MIAMPGVVNAAEEVEDERKARIVQGAMTQYLDQRQPHGDIDVAKHLDWPELLRRLFNENDERLAVLITACRDDIASLRQ